MRRPQAFGLDQDGHWNWFIETYGHLPLYPVAPILFVVATCYLLGNALIDDSSRWPTLAIFGVIALGVPIYYLTVARTSRGAGERAG